MPLKFAFDSPYDHYLCARYWRDATRQRCINTPQANVVRCPIDLENLSSNCTGTDGHQAVAPAPRGTLFTAIIFQRCIRSQLDVASVRRSQAAIARAASNLLAKCSKYVGSVADTLEVPYQRLSLRDAFPGRRNFRNASATYKLLGELLPGKR